MGRAGAQGSSGCRVIVRMAGVARPQEGALGGPTYVESPAVWGAAHPNLTEPEQSPEARGSTEAEKIKKFKTGKDDPGQKQQTGTRRTKLKTLQFSFSLSDLQVLTEANRAPTMCQALSRPCGPGSPTHPSSG